MRGKGITRLYQTGGPDLLAYRLGRIFTKIETPVDIALHNDVLSEVLDIVNKDYPTGDMLSPEESRMLRTLAEWILNAGNKS